VISQLRGKLIACELTEITVDVHGIGLSISVPMSTYDRLPAIGADVELLTHLHVREDCLQLSGFATEEERRLFRLLITVSGVGNKIALNILSCMSVGSFCQIVAAEDTKALSRVNGIGKRSAERLVMELRERVAEIEPTAGVVTAGKAAASSREVQDAIAALATLGFKGEAVRRAVHKLHADLPPAKQTAENLIRKALASLNS